MAKMSFKYLMGLLEECHRFENVKFKRISEPRLIGNERWWTNTSACFTVRWWISE